MRLFIPALVALVAISPLPAGAAPAPAVASAPEMQAAGLFVDALSEQAFAVLRDKALTKTQVRAKFRSILKSSFDVNTIGAKLIRSHRASLTPAQLQSYLAVFPDFVVGSYADRLYDYASSDLKIIRTQPRGSRGDIDVFSRIKLPNNATPFEAIWSVRRMPDGKFNIQNLTVAGVNLSLTQEADFTAYIQRNSFDGLLQFMREAAAK